MIGDSLSMGFYVSSVVSMLLRARTSARRNWVVDDRGIIDSVFERLSKRVPITLYHFACVSANVDPVTGSRLVDSIAGICHMSQQVNRILSLAQFPEVVMLWIGHNNLDWVESCEGVRTSKEHLKQRADEIVARYKIQLTRLVASAAKTPHPVRIVVFALVDFKKFFKAREQTERIKSNEPSRYPYLERDYKYFRSMLPQFRTGMIELAEMINDGLQSAVENLVRDAKLPPTFRLVFSTALREADISRAEMLCEVDGWHPSTLGHCTLAASVFPTISDLADEIIEQR